MSVKGSKSISFEKLSREVMGVNDEFVYDDQKGSSEPNSEDSRIDEDVNRPKQKDKWCDGAGDFLHAQFSVRQR